MDEPRIIPPLDDGIKPYYAIYRNGTIINTISGKQIIPQINHAGYLTVNLMTETGRVARKVHRLVLIVYDFNPNYRILQGNHKNCNKLDCSLGNLEWTTPKENVDHAIENDLRSSFIGEENINASLIEYQVLAIADMIYRGYPEEAIFKVIPEANHSMILNIVSGNTWSYLFTNEYLDEIYSRFHHTISIRNRHMICKYYQDHQSVEVKKPYGFVTKIAKEALISLGLELSEKNIKIAKRLYYRYDNPEITSLYKY